MSQESPEDHIWQFVPARRFFCLIGKDAPFDLFQQTLQRVMRQICGSLAFKARLRIEHGQVTLWVCKWGRQSMLMVIVNWGLGAGF